MAVYCGRCWNILCCYYRPRFGFRSSQEHNLNSLAEQTQPQAASPRRVEPTRRDEHAPSHSEALTGIAAAMARQMTASLAIPQFTFCDELELGELLRVKQRLVPVFAEQDIKLTLLPFFINFWIDAKSKLLY